MLMGKRSSHGAVVRLAETGFVTKVERWSPGADLGEDCEQGYSTGCARKATGSGG